MIATIPPIPRVAQVLWYPERPSSAEFARLANAYPYRRVEDLSTGLWMVRPPYVPNWENLDHVQRTVAPLPGLRGVGVEPVILEVIPDVGEDRRVAGWIAHLYFRDYRTSRMHMPVTSLTGYEWCPLTFRGEPLIAPWA